MKRTFSAQVWVTSVALWGACGGSSNGTPESADATDTGSEATTSEAEDTATDTTTASGDESTGSPGSTGADDVPIGTLVDRGTRELPQSTTNPPVCDHVCEALGGSCDDAGAGRSYYQCETGSHGGKFYTCAYAEEAEYIDFDGELCRLTEYSCTCHDVLLEEPYVEVLASDGLYACADVCASWALTCAMSGGDAFVDDNWLQDMACDEAPPEASTRYTCYCDPP